MSTFAARPVPPTGWQHVIRRIARTAFHPVAASIWVLLLFWLFATIFVPPSILPPPLKVIGEVGKSLRSKTFVDDILLSMGRIWAGWAAGMVVAVVLGVLMGSKGVLNVVIRDYVLVFMSMPLLVWALLGVLWFGGDITASIVAIALVAGPQGSVNIYEGICNVERDLLDAARVYRVPKRDILLRIMVPSMMPFIVATGRQTFAMAWKTISLLEIFGASGGIGYQIEQAFERMSVAGVLSWVVVFMCIMLVIESVIFGQFERYIFRWRPAIGEMK
jgi:ABC-type nitrate/sulfonate/bicarbonate transport system permease component